MPRLAEGSPRRRVRTDPLAKFVLSENALKDDETRQWKRRFAEL
jgi:hypothetical protein